MGLGSAVIGATVALFGRNTTVAVWGGIADTVCDSGVRFRNLVLDSGSPDSRSRCACREPDLDILTTTVLAWLQVTSIGGTHNGYCGGGGNRIRHLPWTHLARDR